MTFIGDHEFKTLMASLRKNTGDQAIKRLDVSAPEKKEAGYQFTMSQLAQLAALIGSQSTHMTDVFLDQTPLNQRSLALLIQANKTGMLLCVNVSYKPEAGVSKLFAQSLPNTVLACVLSSKDPIPVQVDKQEITITSSRQGETSSSGKIAFSIEDAMRACQGGVRQLDEMVAANQAQRVKLAAIYQESRNDPAKFRAKLLLFLVELFGENSDLFSLVQQNIANTGLNIRKVLTTALKGDIDKYNRWSAALKIVANICLAHKNDDYQLNARNTFDKMVMLFSDFVAINKNWLLNGGIGSMQNNELQQLDKILTVLQTAASSIFFKCRAIFSATQLTIRKKDQCSIVTNAKLDLNLCAKIGRWLAQALNQHAVSDERTAEIIIAVKYMNMILDAAKSMKTKSSSSNVSSTDMTNYEGLSTEFGPIYSQLVELVSLLDKLGMDETYFFSTEPHLFFDNEVKCQRSHPAFLELVDKLDDLNRNSGLSMSDDLMDFLKNILSKSQVPEEDKVAEALSRFGAFRVSDETAPPAVNANNLEP